jgi:8-oxo-dGTP pyrophosphatase MutT (NUDIX family)
LGPSPDRGGRGPRPDPPGFRHVADETVHRGFIVSTVKASFVDPDGNRFDRDVIRHPGAVAIVPLTEADSVLLVHQFRPAVDRWILEVPAGTRDVDGEPPETTAHRELAEELGRGAGRLDLLTHCLNTPGFCDEVTTVFLATDLHPVPTNRQGLEERFMSVEELSLSRFDELVDEGTIVDAVTILGVALARRRRQGSVRAG